MRYVLDQRAAFDLAVRNISRWGDTDVFPFAPENHVLHDRREAVVDLLVDWYSRQESALVEHPALFEGALSLVSAEGFRWVTQLDPVWNAYFLGLVLRIAPEIEAARVEDSREVVYSYRIDVDQDRASLFREGVWREFAQRSVVLTEEHEWVVQCDIADFYSRIDHHRLDNALQLLSPAVGDVPTRIDRLLRSFSGGPSYGLPVADLPPAS